MIYKIILFFIKIKVKMKTGINGNQLMPRNNFFKKHTELDLIYLKVCYKLLSY